MSRSPHAYRHLSCKCEDDYLLILGDNEKSKRLSKFIISAPSKPRFGVEVTMLFEDYQNFTFILEIYKMENEIIIGMLQPLIKINLSKFHHNHCYITSITNTIILSPCNHNLIQSFPRVKLLLHKDILTERGAILDI
jgi:hypothetical protein